MQLGIAEILLIVAGIVSLLIVMTYREDKDSTKYKACVFLGLLAGIAVIAVGAMHYKEWSTFDTILIFIAAFALVIRPFRKTEIALIAAIVVMIAVYVSLGTLTGDWAFLAESTPRIIISIVAGALVYMTLHFVEKIADLLGKILNLWPVLLVLGLICIVEGALIIANGTSLFDYIQEYRSGASVIALAL